MMILKDKPLRSKEYMAWVKTLPSCISGQPSSDAHHVKGKGYYGIKPPDYMTIPLTRIEHTHFHNIGHKAWEEIHGNQMDYVVQTITEAFKQGILIIK